MGSGKPLYMEDDYVFSNMDILKAKYPTQCPNAKIGLGWTNKILSFF